MRGNASVGQASRPVKLLRHFSCGADYRFSWSAMHSTDRDARFGLTGRPQKMMVCPTLVRRPPLCEHKLEFALARTGRQAGPTFLLLAMLATLAAPQLPARNVALVIGNQSYGPGALEDFPASDARLVEAALREAGFVTVLRENITRSRWWKPRPISSTGSNLEIPPSSISPVTLWPSRTKTSWWEWIAVRATVRRHPPAVAVYGAGGRPGCAYHRDFGRRPYLHRGCAARGQTGPGRAENLAPGTWLA